MSLNAHINSDSGNQNDQLVNNIHNYPNPPNSQGSNLTITSSHQLHLDHIRSELKLKNLNSNLRSTSPSITSSTNTISTSASSKYQGRRYTGKLPISDIPELIDLCNQFLKSRNITGLALLARQSGLPPYLRCKIWPILLKYHPFVQNPYIEIEIDDDDDDEEDEEDESEEENDEENQPLEENSEYSSFTEISDRSNSTKSTLSENTCSTESNFKSNLKSKSKSKSKPKSKLKSKSKSKDNDDSDEYKIPYNEIKFDLRKYLRSAERYKPKVLSLEMKDMYEIQDKIFEVIEHAIVKFLKKWGTILHYNSALAWIALGLAEWVPPLPNSQFVLCGRDDVAKNGTKLRNVYDNYFETLNSNSNITSDASSFMDSPRYSQSPIDSTTPLASPQNTPPSGFKQMSFAEIYERMVLVILHTPDPTTIDNLEISKNIISPDSKISKELKELALLPYTGGTISDRISFFLFCMRKLLPELHTYLAEEDCLNGDWILWWLKYDGSKVWSRYDRGRTWDLLLGYRTNCKNFESNMNELSQLSNEQISLLGQDLFWNPMDNLQEDSKDQSILENLNKDNYKHNYKDNNLNNIAVDDNDEDFDPLLQINGKHDRSLSVLTLISKNRSPSISFDKTPTLSSLPLNSPKTPLSNLSELDIKNNGLASLEEIEPIIQLPFSKIHPHVEVIFISLAFLKSKEFTITELDQSEIKTLFGRLSSLRTDFGEMSSFVSTQDENGKGNTHLNINNDDENGKGNDLLFTENHNNNNNNNKNSNNNNNNISSNNVVTHEGHINGDMQTVLTYHRKSNRDIENILIEAGELWRRFLYINMMEETDLGNI
ncbi:hypothetical protein C6P42_002829 [Pichia californica]|nr:hypothetical protein C6P42_002829 [[Candida] californica]